MANHRTGCSVERTVCITLMRDPRVIGIVAGTHYSTLGLVGVPCTYEQAHAWTLAVRDDMEGAADVVDGERIGGDS